MILGGSKAISTFEKLSIMVYKHSLDLDEGSAPKKRNLILKRERKMMLGCSSVIAYACQDDTALGLFPNPTNKHKNNRKKWIFVPVLLVS